MSYSVLLIEDNQTERTLICDYLQDHLLESIEILCCKSYEEAFGPIFYKSWDVILINYHLSQRNGLETLKRIKGILGLKNSPIILYHSSKDHLNLSKIALDEGASELIQKREMVGPQGLAKIQSYLNQSNSSKPIPN